MEESNGNSAIGAVGGVIGAVAGAIGAAIAIADWADRSTIIEVMNMSPETLYFGYNLHSGDLQRPLPQQIAPFDTAIIISVSDTFSQGAEVDLNFRGRDMGLFVDCSNPFVGVNHIEAEVKGARAREFHCESSAGPGNKSARFYCTLWQDWQDGWRFCPKCRSIFTPGLGSRCPAGGPHEPVGWNYVLLHDVPEGPNLQATWRFCPKCRGLFAEGDGNGVCPAGGAHDPVGWRYCVPHDLAAGPHLQVGWRFCGKCRALFGEAEGNGVCPAGGAHLPLGWPYLMAFATPQP